MTNNDIIAFYLYKLSLSRLPTKATTALIEFAEDISVDILGYDIREKWGAAPRRRRMHGLPDFHDAGDETDLPAPEYQRCPSSLITLLSERKYVDIHARGADRCVDCVADLFHLNDIDRKILQLFINMDQIQPLKSFIGDLMDGRRFSSMPFNTRDADIIGILCGLGVSQVRAALDADSVLSHAGLLAIDSDGDISLNRFIQRTISANTTDISELKRILLGQVHRGNMNLDFSHVKSAYDFISQILDNAVRQQTAGVNILIYGYTGTGKTEMAKHIVSALGYDLYGLHASNKTRQDRKVNLSYLMHAQRILINDKNSVVLLDEAEDIFVYDRFGAETISKLALNQLLERNTRPVIWLTNDINCVDPAYLRRFSYCFEMPQPEQSFKEQMWTNICALHQFELSPAAISEYASKYNVVPGVINNAVRMAKLTGQQSAIDTTLESLCGILREYKNDEETSASKFNPALLNTDVDMVRLTDQILNCRTKNFSLCLYGASGTGKSAYARYLADKMGLKVICKRVSDLKDKYVGETEKHIAAAFREARQKNAMLIFDEADSFLRDRKYARASWEVSEVNEMLTQMEKASIPFVCTTNLMDDMDRASLRRFLFKVRYDYMTIPQVVQAFQDFFGITVTEADVSHLRHLAPGDFVVVKHKADILGVTSLSDLTRMLQDEIGVKNIKQPNRIGFGS